MFGTLADLDALIAAAHARGIKIVMDLVVNHTSDEHPWFVASRSSTDDPKRDWYIWRKTPNNWQSIFSGSAWEHDPITDEYYLHLFSRKQPDLNWENPEVRAGRLRDDAVVGRPRGRRLPHGRHQPDLQDPPACPTATPGRPVRQRTAGARVPRRDAPGGAGRTRSCSPWGRRPARASTTPAATPTRPVPRSTWCSRSSTSAWTRARPSGTCARCGSPRSRPTSRRGRTASRRSGWNSLYWDNHDQPRIVSRWGDDGEHRVASAKTLATVLHLLRGTPYVYQGEELGMTNAHFTSWTPTATSSRSTGRRAQSPRA